MFITILKQLARGAIVGSYDRDTLSVNRDCPETHSVDQADLELHHVSATWPQTQSLKE